MGDFNIDLIKYQQHVYSTEFLDNMLSHFLLPLINRPTRITSHTASLIDNIFTNNTSESHSGILITDISDHLPIYTVVYGQQTSPNNQPTGCTRRNINALTKEHFQNELAKCKWKNVYNATDNPNEAYDNFLSTYTNIFNNSFPYITISRKKANLNNKPWITKGLLKSINT